MFMYNVYLILVILRCRFFKVEDYRIVADDWANITVSSCQHTMGLNINNVEVHKK